MVLVAERRILLICLEALKQLASGMGCGGRLGGEGLLLLSFTGPGR